MMLSLFQDYIAQQHLFPSGEKVLLAVSGGRDSVAMTDLVHRSGIPFSIAHCNFHLRGDESDRDQQFVHCLAERLGVTFHTFDFDTHAIAAECHEGIEEAARHLRYEWFARLCTEHGYACVATAHHRDDSIETLLLNLFRGTGIHGLHGIRPITELKIKNDELIIVRPLLPFSRADIDHYVSERGLEYVDDSTNSEAIVRRNQIRLEILPFLRRYYPNIDTILQADIDRFAAAEQLYDNYIVDLRTRLVTEEPSRLPTFQSSLTALHLIDVPCPRATVLYELLSLYGFSADIATEILRSPKQSGGLYQSPTHEAVVDRGRLVIAPRDIVPPALTLQVDPLALQSPSDVVTQSSLTIFVDADQLRLPLRLRPWREGDRFCPFGMKGTRLVSDFLKDSKLNLFEKRQVQVAVDADDRIMWVVGLRADNRFRITDATRQALQITCQCG